MKYKPKHRGCPKGIHTLVWTSTRSISNGKYKIIMNEYVCDECGFMTNYDTKVRSSVPASIFDLTRYGTP